MPKGHVEPLPSGSFRVSEYGGIDSTTGKQRRLRRTVKTEVEAVEAIAKFLRDVEAEREPRESATLSDVLERYLEVSNLDLTTRDSHEGYIRRTVCPVLGHVKIGKLRADMLDSLYAHLKRCRRLCGRLPRAEHHSEGQHECDSRCGPLKDHRTPRAHVCDQRCLPHQCQPMAPGSILRIHSIISAALSLAVRYDWIDRNVANKATPPQPPKREPEPPSPRQVARLLNHLWIEDPEFALFVWLATTTGARRGELVGLREHRINFELQELWVARNYVVKQGRRLEKEPKTGKGRRFALDPLTCELLREYLRQRRALLATVGVEVPQDAFVFSPDPALPSPGIPTP